MGPPSLRPGAPRRLWPVLCVAAVAAAAVVAPVAHAGPGGPKDPAPPTCRPADKGDWDAIWDVARQARLGVPVPAGAIDPPALTVGRPAELRVALGPDPLGIAAALGVRPAAFWGDAGATVGARGPGLAARARLRADGSATLSVTPPAEGAVTMRLYVPGSALQRALGLCSRPIWGLGSWLTPPGATPGAPVLQVEGLPEPPPNPGGEGTPEQPPTPGPEPAP